MGAVEMNKYNVFLRWVLSFALILLGTFIAYSTGTISQVNNLDFTKISFLIYFLFMVCTVYTGINTYKICKGSENITSDRIETFNHRNEISWFMAEAMFTLGMIGTVAGFIAVLSSNFTGIDPSDVNSTKAALAGMSAGMGTALYTTATGLICSLILKLQVFNISYHLDVLAKRCVCKGDSNVTK